MDGPGDTKYREGNLDNYIRKEVVGGGRVPLVIGKMRDADASD
ncbi:hypothetical protein [Salmonirosea aquatica]